MARTAAWNDNTSLDLQYITNASGSWQTSTIDSQGDVGADSSLGVDSSGKAHLSYLDHTNKDLTYVAICP